MNILTALPGDVFTPDIDTSYKSLVKRYHPDLGGTNEEFAALTTLKTLAKKQLQDGYLAGSDFLYLTENQTTYHYTDSVDFELGTLYMGPQVLLYRLSPHPANSRVPTLTYPSPDAGKVMRPSIPVIERIGAFHVIKKPEEFIPISDIIAREPPQETTVWILNRLMSLACLLDYNNLVHLDISPSTVFVDLEHHAVALYGGWWHTVERGAKISTLPVRTYNLLPRGVKTTKLAESSIMVDQIKLLITEMKKKRNFHKSYEGWLTLPASSDIIQEYSEWESVVLPRIFPTRKFFKWP